METSQHEISDEGECGDGLVFGNDGKFPSKKGSKEKSSQKQIHVEGHTPVKGKEIKASAKELVPLLSMTVTVLGALYTSSASRPSRDGRFSGRR